MAGTSRGLLGAQAPGDRAFGKAVTAPELPAYKGAGSKDSMPGSTWLPAWVQWATTVAIALGYTSEQLNWLTRPPSYDPQGPVEGFGIGDKVAAMQRCCAFPPFKPPISSSHLTCRVVYEQCILVPPLHHGVMRFALTSIR